MVFADLFFIYIFLPLCLIAYFAARTLTQKNIVLIVFSVIFYAWGEPIYVFMLIFSAFFNWLIGKLIDTYRDYESQSKMWLAIGIIVDLALLMVFKYTGFFVENINGLFRCSIPVPDIRLPIGISFFTFQAVSYIIDVYWESVEAQQSFYKFLLYLSLFPQLIAGPIVRYSVIEEEIDNRKTTINDLCYGSIRVICGLAKKVILANNLYTIVTNFFGTTDAPLDISSLSFLGTWYVVIIYSMYVYFDFSGYSDIAIGLGRIFGFHFDENFNYPFACETIAEFWQRWHISLGSFFRDYLLYIPIAGHHFKYLNLFLVWFCTGMWHGASWNFILWGLYFGCWIFFEQRMGKKRMKKWPVWVKHIYSKVIIIIGFGIFQFEDLKRLGVFLRNVTGISFITNGIKISDTLTRSSLVNNIFLILVSLAVCMPVMPLIKRFFTANRNEAVYKAGRIVAAVGSMVMLVVISILLVDTTSNPFLYFRF